MDAEGLDLAFASSEGTATAQVDFLEPVKDYPAGVRVAFVRLARRARDLLEPGHAPTWQP